MNPFIWLLLYIIEAYFWIVVAMVILSWLTGFNVVNPRNPVVRQIQYGLYRLTEPLLGPIRRFMPDLGGLDISPMVLLIGLLFLEKAIEYYALGA